MAQAASQPVRPMYSRPAGNTGRKAGDALGNSLTLRLLAYFFLFLPGHIAKHIPQKIPTNAARPQSSSSVLLRKPV
jgi:hypothetical protein